MATKLGKELANLLDLVVSSLFLMPFVCCRKKQNYEVISLIHDSEEELNNTEDGN